MKTKPTPGPLIVYTIGGGVGPIIAYETQTPDSKTVGVYNVGSNENAEADAILGGVAPDLLRFAKDIEKDINDALRPGSPDTFMSLAKRLMDYRAWARAAIAKAEEK